MGSAANVLANAKKALANANKFTSSVTGGKPDAFAPKSKPSYALAHAARAASAGSTNSGEFMGVRANEAPELNAALKSRAEAKKALEQ